MKADLIKILEVIKLGEKLKYEMRHSWLSNGRRESVAEHTWRVALMAILITPKLKVEADIGKLLKMIIIHDLVEAEAGDIPAFDTIDNEELKRQKAANELVAIENIRDTLGDETGSELFYLWTEFEEKISIEAQIANALDKLEAQIQHNESDLSTWLNIEHEMSFKLDRHVEFNPVMQAFKELIEEEAVEKLIKGGVDVAGLKTIS